MTAATVMVFSIFKVYNRLRNNIEEAVSVAKRQTYATQP